MPTFIFPSDAEEAIWLFAAATTFSAVKPNFFNSCLSDAEGAKDFEYKWFCPSEPVYLHHPKSDASPTEMRAEFVWATIPAAASLVLDVANAMPKAKHNER
jgi:hypothetical protein